jgi:hypothetical protein
VWHEAGRDFQGTSLLAPAISVDAKGWGTLIREDAQYYKWGIFCALSTTRGSVFGDFQGTVWQDVRRVPQR